MICIIIDIKHKVIKFHFVFQTTWQISCDRKTTNKKLISIRFQTQIIIIFLQTIGFVCFDISYNKTLLLYAKDTIFKLLKHNCTIYHWSNIDYYLANNYKIHTLWLWKRLHLQLFQLSVLVYGNCFVWTCYSTRSRYVRSFYNGVWIVIVWFIIREFIDIMLLHNVNVHHLYIGYIKG